MLSHCIYYLLTRDVLSHDVSNCDTLATVWRLCIKHGHRFTRTHTQKSFVDPAHVPFLAFRRWRPLTNHPPPKISHVPTRTCQSQLVTNLALVLETGIDGGLFVGIGSLSFSLSFSFSVRIIMEEAALLRERLQAITVSIRLHVCCCLVLCNRELRLNWDIAVIG